MSKQFKLQALIAVLAAGMMFSSCGNIDIVKRKYRPGFHVDVSQKRQKMKAADRSAARDKRESEKTTAMASKKAKPIPVADDHALTASTTDMGPVRTAKHNDGFKAPMRSPEFSGLSFKRKMKVIENNFLSPKPAGVSWMKWVSFGTGIGSLAFGAIALILALIMAGGFWTPAVWPMIVLALLLGAAAITFSLLYKKNQGADAQSRLGFIFGIIGAGLAVLAIVFWAIFWTVFWL